MARTRDDFTCPRCGVITISKVKYMDPKTVGIGGFKRRSIKRSRNCSNCKRNFITYEIVREDLIRTAQFEAEIAARAKLSASISKRRYRDPNQPALWPT